MIYQNLIFDLDGTLVDSLPGIHTSMQAAIDQVLPGEVMPEMRQVVGPPLLQMFQKMWPELSQEKLEKLVIFFREDYDRRGFLKTERYPHVIEVLSALKQEGYHLYLLTNKPKIPTELILKHLGLDHFFIDQISPDSLNPAFTEKAEGLRHLVKHYGMDLKQSVMIGDSSDDALAAKEVGMKFIAAEYGYGEVLKKSEFSGEAKIQNIMQLVDRVCN